MEPGPAHAADQVFEVRERLGGGTETRRKLGQQWTQFAGFGQRADPLGEHAEVVLLDLSRLTSRRLEHLRMSELLPQLGGEAEVVRDLRGPRARRVHAGRPVERAVDLDGVEVLRVEGELVLVGELGRIEHPVPGALTLWITPA